MREQKPVVLFIQCLIDSHYPEIGEAVLQLFDNLKIEVSYPLGQTCCGQPAFNAGYTKEARKAAVHFLDVFDQDQMIICPSGSCTKMVRHHYPELFRNDPKLHRKALNIANNIYELSEYLIDMLKVKALDSEFNARVTYHDTCHLASGLGIRNQPRKLLSMVKGLELVEMHNSDECCGFGGSFSVKYPEISTAMVDDKVNNILETKAEYVVGCDTSCLMNIEGRLHRRKEKPKVLHLAQVLAAQGENR